MKKENSKSIPLAVACDYCGNLNILEHKKIKKCYLCECNLYPCGKCNLYRNGCTGKSSCVLINSKTEIKFKMAEFCKDLAPIKAHEDDAAYDIKSRICTVLEPGIVTLIPTGLFIELPVGFEAQIRPRSGLALKHGLMIVNSPGTIDAGYRGEVGVIMLNAGKEPVSVMHGDRIAQMVINKLPVVALHMVQNLNDSERGAGGFGSTGTNANTSKA